MEGEEGKNEKVDLGIAHGAVLLDSGHVFIGGDAVIGFDDIGLAGAEGMDR